MNEEKAQSSSRELLRYFDQILQKEFDTNRRVLTFDQYLALFSDQPDKQSRSSSGYLVDMMDHFGKTPVGSKRAEKDHSSVEKTYRFKVFDLPVDGIAPKVVGQEEVQTAIYRALRSFVRQRINNKLLLLHGPNGSAKSTIAHALMGGVERYSKEKEGASYSFNWVFPVERYAKKSMGITSYTQDKNQAESYANLVDEEVAARVPCEMKDHPLFLIPKEHRKEFLGRLLGEEKAKELWNSATNYFTQGEVCHRCKQIFEALLTANGGDYKKVLCHVQVERFFFSRRYRKGLATVEPQLHVDARYNQLTIDKNISSLPPSLHGINFFTLSGDLVDGNRGIIEYSDLLKRPVDSFKYLLIACETGAVNVGASIAYLDTAMIGSSNELQLDAFKEFPDFSSFKARIQLIRVPYLLKLDEEREIYKLLLPQLAEEKHVAPHVDWVLALWAVLTRMKKPNSINYPPNISTLVANLTPMEKVRLYNAGEIPHTLNAEEKKLLRAHKDKIRQEYENIPYYEGRIGASVREVKSILFEAVHHPEFPCLSPLAILRQMKEFVKHVSEYEFLKQDVKDGYHDASEFINVVETEYLDKIDHEVRESIGLYDSQQWEDFIQKYVLHLSALLKKEKIRNEITGKSEDPDTTLIKEFEAITDAPKSEKELTSFRQNILSQVGAWALENKNEKVIYQSVFPEYWQKLEKHYFESQKSLLTKMHNALLVYDNEKAKQNTEGSELAQQTVDTMVNRRGYCEKCAQEVINFLMQKRY